MTSSAHSPGALFSEYAVLQERILTALGEELSEPEFAVLALQVHVFQKKWNAPYAAFCARRPIAKTWREIPAVPQVAFKISRLSVFGSEQIARVFRTSGTTGEGFGEHHFPDLTLYHAALRRGWARLHAPNLPAIFLTPDPRDAPHSSLAEMFAVLGKDFPASESFVDAAGKLQTEALFVRLRELCANGPAIALFGTALAFLQVFDRSGSASCFQLPEGSFAVETGGYKGIGRTIPKAELYALFAHHLGLSADAVINEYGMTELSSQAYTRGLGRPHETPPWMRFAVIDPETEQEVAIGKTGTLRLFDLANLGSVLAVQTEDLAIRRVTGFEIIGRDPAALARGCSRAADEQMSRAL